LKNKRDHQDGYSPQPTRAVQTLVPDRRFWDINFNDKRVLRRRVRQRG